MTYLMGLDIGTSAVKGVLLGSEGIVVSREQNETRIQIGREGVIQFDADELYKIVAGVIRKLSSKLPVGTSISGLSISSASGNTLLVDDEGKPMLPAFSWMDTRVKDDIQAVFGELKGDEVHQLVGWPLIPTFPLAHLSWLKRHKPELLKQSSRVCMSTDYILYKLTGEWGIDSSTATTFYLQDQQAVEWHLPYLQKLGIAKEKLPKIYAPATVLGRIQPEAVQETGLSTETTVVLGSFDHPSAARGAGVLDEGQLLLSCGTSWVGFYPLKDRNKAIRQALLTDPFLQPEGAWGAMFALSAISTSVDNYVRKYISSTADRYEEFSRLAAAAQPGAGGLMINPQSDGDFSSPEGQSKANIARALMEGTAYLLKKKIEELKTAGMPVHSATMVGGPSETFPWPQIVADVLEIELSTVNGSCAGAVGSAIMAGIGLGLYKDEREALERLIFPKTTRKPDMETSRFYNEQYRKFIKK